MNENLIQKIRASLRIKTPNFDDEIETLIEACKNDLSLAGARTFDESDQLCMQAVIFYCKANFGFSDDAADKYLERYKILRDVMALSSKYGGGKSI